MAFLAVTIKHPIIVDYMSKYTLKMLAELRWLRFFIKKQYGVVFTEHTGVDKHIMLASLGMKYAIPTTTPNLKLENEIKELIETLKIHKLNDNWGAQTLVEYLKFPKYLIILFVEGFINEDQVTLYVRFFGNEIDLAIRTMIDVDNTDNIFAYDLAETLYNGLLHINSVPTLALLIQLWNKKINDNSVNVYREIILFCLRKLPIEEVIENSPCIISELHIGSILSICGVKKIDSIYDLENIKKPLDGNIIAKGMQDTRFKEIPVIDFDKNILKEIIQIWIKRVEKDFSSKKIDVYLQHGLVSVFISYVQWGKL